MKKKGIYRVEVDNPNGDPFSEFYCRNLQELKDLLIKFKDWYICRMVYVYKCKKKEPTCIFACCVGKIYVDTKSLFGKHIDRQDSPEYYLWE